jgi:hypothetical protein
MSATKPRGCRPAFGKIRRIRCANPRTNVAELPKTILDRGRASVRQGTINHPTLNQSVATGEFKASAMIKLGLQFGKFKLNVSVTTYFALALLIILL